MAKFYGMIGYAETKETVPGVWEEVITEKPYYGDVVRNMRTLQSASQVNDDVNISNEISVLADPYATMNFHMIRYVTFMGAKWKVTSVEVVYPRLTLTIGGLYHGESLGTAHPVM